MQHESILLKFKADLSKLVAMTVILHRIINCLIFFFVASCSKFINLFNCIYFKLLLYYLLLAKFHLFDFITVTSLFIHSIFWLNTEYLFLLTILKNSETNVAAYL